MSATLPSICFILTQGCEPVWLAIGMSLHSHTLTPEGVHIKQILLVNWIISHIQSTVSAGSCLCAFVVLQWHDSVSTKSVSTVLPFSYCCCCRYSTAASAAKVLAFEYRSVWLNLICLLNMIFLNLFVNIYKNIYNEKLAKMKSRKTKL